MIEQGRQILRFQPSAGCLHFSRRHATRCHNIHVEKPVLGALQHVTHAFQSQDIGDFVGIGDDRCDAMRQNRAREFGGVTRLLSM